MANHLAETVLLTQRNLDDITLGPKLDDRRAHPKATAGMEKDLGDAHITEVGPVRTFVVDQFESALDRLDLAVVGADGGIRQRQVADAAPAQVGLVSTDLDGLSRVGPLHHG